MYEVKYKYGILHSLYSLFNLTLKLKCGRIKAYINKYKEKEVLEAMFFNKICKCELKRSKMLNPFCRIFCYGILCFFFLNSTACTSQNISKIEDNTQISIENNISQMEYKNFRVEGTRIIAPDGNEFIIKGVNVNGPNWPWSRDTLQDAELICDIWGFNTVRVNCFPRLSYIKTNLDLDSIVNAFTSKKIVVQLEVHDYTGTYPKDRRVQIDEKHFYPSLQELIDWWVDKAQRYKRNPYVWFNIMNEPGGPENVPEDWKTAHEAVISAIRDTGANNIIVLDGHQFGQESGGREDIKSGILKYGEYFANNYNNIVFSLHMYYEWTNGQERLEQYINKAHQKNLCLHIGEYGGTNGDYKVNGAVAAMFNACMPKNIGRILWHWAGDDQFDLTYGTSKGGGWEINRTDGNKPSNLSWFGNLVWQDLRDKLVPGYNDLAINEISISRQNFRKNEKLKFAAVVQNMGLRKIQPEEKVKVNFIINEKFLSSHLIQGPFDLSEGKTIVSDEWIVDNNSCKVRVEIDLKESSYGQDMDDSNNCLEMIFYGKDNKAHKGLSISISDFRLDKQQILYGDSVKPLLKITNTGSDPATSETIRLSFNINGVQQLFITDIISLKPGESKVVDVPHNKYIKLIQKGDINIIANLYMLQNGAISRHTENTLFKTFKYSGNFENLVINGSFEDDLNDWMNWGRFSSSTDFPKSGVKCGMVSQGGTGGGGQFLQLKPNTTYVLETWGKNDRAVSKTTDVGVKYKLPDGKEPHHFLNFSENEYVKKSVKFTTPEEFTDPILFIWKADSDVNFYIDDIRLYELK